jgi:DNA-binding MarR family transcriptional regulator
MSRSGPVSRPPIAPMMRVLWQEVRDRIHIAFAEEGHDLRAEHLAVLQHPGPDGQRPSALAARSGMSRQAINHLVSHLEQAGYLERYTDPTDRNSRLIRLTDRGRRLYERIEAVAATIEAEWAEQVGAPRLEELRTTLSDLLTHRAAGDGGSGGAAGAGPAAARS